MGQQTIGNDGTQSKGLRFQSAKPAQPPDTLHPNQIYCKNLNPAIFLQKPDGGFPLLNAMQLYK